MAGPSPFNPIRGTRSSLRGGGGFNRFAAGDKRYGAGQAQAPNVGPVANKSGYAARDMKYDAYAEALKRRRGNHGNAV